MVDGALDELIDAVVAEKHLTGGGLEMGNLVAPAFDVPPVGLASVSEKTCERMFSQEVVGPIMADDGLEVRPMMVKGLAEFTNEDYSYGRVSRWTRCHDKSANLNYVAPELNELEAEPDLVEKWFRRVGRYK